jgi:hypothetical protein
MLRYPCFASFGGKDTGLGEMFEIERALLEEMLRIEQMLFFAGYL